MTILQIVQDVTDEIGLPQPTAVIGSNDQTVRSLLALANREGKELSRRHRWQILTKEATWTTLATEDQGSLANTDIVADGDFDLDYGIINETVFNRDDQFQTFGPVSPRGWQARKASTNTGPYSEYRIRQNKLFLTPAPAVGETGAFEYKSLHWCEDSGATGQARWAADTDVGRISEDLMTLGLKWRWLKSKGLDYAEEFRTYELSVQSAVAHDGSSETLFMDQELEDTPTIRAPEGSWPL